MPHHAAPYHVSQYQHNPSHGTAWLQVAACHLELDVAQYADVEERYRLQLVELKTTEMANSDLEKYHKVLKGGTAGGGV